MDVSLCYAYESLSGDEIESLDSASLILLARCRRAKIAHMASERTRTRIRSPCDDFHWVRAYPRVFLLERALNSDTLWPIKTITSGRIQFIHNHNNRLFIGSHAQ